MGTSKYRDALPIGIHGSTIDRVTNGVSTITTDHAQIHKKRAYSFSYPYTAPLILDGGQTISIQFKTPQRDVSIVHWKHITLYSNGNNVMIQLIENPQLTNGTNTIVSHNRSRPRVKKQSDAQIFSNPVGVTGGEILETFYILGAADSQGQGNSRVTSTGDNINLDVEWVLDTDTNYVIRVTNNDPSIPARYGMWVFWYEEKPYTSEEG